MLTEAVLTKIQEAMQDKDFAKLVMEEKTEEGIANLLKDKKGIVVSVEDINDLTQAVTELSESDLDISGGADWKETAKNVLQGGKNAFGFGKTKGSLEKSLKFQNGLDVAAGTYGAYTLAAAAIGLVTYGGAKLGTYLFSKLSDDHKH